MAGRHRYWRPVVAATASAPFRRRPDGKVHFVPSWVRVDGEGITADPSPRQGAHLLTSLAGTNALAVVPDGPGLPVGGRVTTWVLDAESVLSR
jgi:molybdopterin biosynthesis enzyme